MPSAMLLSAALTLRQWQLPVPALACCAVWWGASAWARFCSGHHAGTGHQSIEQPAAGLLPARCRLLARRKQQQ